MADWQQLLFPPGQRLRIQAFVASAVLAIGFGFVVVSPPRAESLIAAGGYYYVLAVFAAWGFYIWRVIGARSAVWQQWLRPGGMAVALVAGLVFAVWADEFKHKVLFDEYVLQGTAWHMHATKEIGTPIRAYDISGTWLAIDTFLDKRPYFFTFLLSLLHDLTGFRIENVFALNVAFAGVCLALTCWLVQALTGRRSAAVVAVALLATLPLFGQNATGAGMELHNLAMIAAVMTCATLYLRAPDADRLSALVLGTVLLAQSRYESVLFVGPVAVVIVLGWWRARRLFLPWAAIVAPLLLVPYAWHDRIVDTKSVLWQLREGETARFALQYLRGNLEGARNFYFATSPGQPNSLWLTLLGLVGGAWALVRIGRWFLTPSTGSGQATRDRLTRLFHTPSETHDRLSPERTLESTAVPACGTALGSSPNSSRGLKHRAPFRTAAFEIAGPSSNPAAWVVALFGLAIVANVTLLMFYYWSRFDEPIAARFALPSYLLLALLAGWWVGSVESPRIPAFRIAMGGLVIWFLVIAAPAYSRRIYTSQNLVMRELEWELERVTARRGPLLLITSKATMPFLLHRVPTVNTASVRLRGPQIAWHMKAGTFQEVVVAQVVRPTSEQGEGGIDPDDVLPPEFRLQPLEQKRFGGRWIRLSRLVEIAGAPGEAQ